MLEASIPFLHSKLVYRSPCLSLDYLMCIFITEKLLPACLIIGYIVVLEKKPSVVTVRVYLVVVGLEKIRRRRSVIEKKEKNENSKRRERRGDEMLKNFWKIWM